MAAVRRRSGAGIVVALVFFVVLAFVGIGGSIWFYQQLLLKDGALVATNNAIDEAIAAKFTEHGANLPSTTDATGLRYGREQLAEVSPWLDDAAMLRGPMREAVGYDTPEEVRVALTEAPGDRDFTSVEDALGFYATNYPNLQSQLKAAQDQVTDLEGRIADNKQKHDNELTALRNELQAARKAYNEDLDKERAINQEQAKDLAAVRNELKKTEDTLDERERLFRQRLAEFQTTIDTLQARIDQLEAPVVPMEPIELIAEGEVTAFNEDKGLRVIQGGEEQGVNTNDRFVVYSVQPDGTVTKKGVIQVSRVLDVISEFFVVEPEGDQTIEKEDNYVSVDTWNQYQRQTAGK